MTRLVLFLARLILGWIACVFTLCGLAGVRAVLRDPEAAVFFGPLGLSLFILFLGGIVLFAVTSWSGWSE